jgi:SseB protein N-terminal domain
MEFEGRDDLREALGAARFGPPTGVFEALLHGRLLVAVGRPDPDAEQPPSVVAGELHVLAMPRDDAEPTALCFTDRAAAEALGLTGPFAIVRLPGLWSFLVGAGMRSATLNAAGPVAATLDAHELAALAEGRVPDERDLPPERMTLRAPSQVPPRVEAALAEAARAQEPVTAAYLLQAGDELVAGLKLEPGTPDADAARALESVATDELAATVLADWEVRLIAAAGVRPAFERPA